MAEEKINEAVWYKDKFTEMIKEYGDKIAKISEDVEKELQKMLEENLEINLFLENLDKKKLKIKNIMEKVLTEHNTFSSIIAYDLGLGVISEDEWKSLDNMTTILSEDNEEADEVGDIINTTRPDINKYEMKAINKAAHPYLTKFMEQTGKNLYDTIITYIIKGPGLTDFNIFKGVFELIKESLSEDFVARIGRLYEKDMKFRESYTKILEPLIKRGKSIIDNIDDLANKVAEDNASPGEIVLFKAFVNLICILLSDNYKGLVLKEFKSKHSHSGRAVQEISNFVNFVDTNSKRYDPIEFPKIVAKYYVENCSRNNDVNSIPSLLYMVSSAIASYTMVGGNIKGIKISKTLKLTKNLNILNRALKGTNLKVKPNGHIIYKHTDGKNYDIDYFKFLDDLDKNKGSFGNINLEYDDNTKFIDVQLFKKLLEEIIDDSNLQTKYAKYIVNDQQETERKQNNIEQGLSYNAQY